MRHLSNLILWSMLMLFPAVSLCAQDSVVDFDRQIRPILSDRCYFCHGPDEANREAGLRLDDRETALEVIEAGDPDASELLRRIESHDADEIMPPPESKLQVTAGEKLLIRRWIEQGANWGEHWAFQTPQKPALPSVKNRTGIENEIDRFLLRRLELEGFRFAEPAPKEKLLRRLTFDLTGLPPTLKELDEFLEDSSPGAYEKAVDRLLASPAFGQRMASNWLDVARYSDTYGYQVDRDRFVWPWRDWVVRSFNENKSYDRFIVEQLAGDLLPNASDDQILATTFNRLHPQKVEGGSVPEEFRVEYVADRTHTFGTAFLGLTLECARCHDHKFDPISQKEYYQLFSFFNNIDEAGLYSFFTPAVPTPTLDLTTEGQEQELAELERKIKELESRSFDKRSDLSWPDVLERAGKPPIEVVDFAKVAVGRNQRSVDARQRPAVTLTGDDPVNLKTGNFQRHQPFSVSLSLLTPDHKERAVVFHRSRAWTDAGSRGYQLLIEDGKLSASLIHFWPGNAIRVRTVSPIPVDQWVDVAMVYDGSSRASGLSIFVGGEKQPVEIVRDHLTRKITGGGGNQIAIGERFRDRGLKGGSVSSFQVFDRQLSSLEVARLHDASSSRELAAAVSNGQITEEQRLKLIEHHVLTGDDPAIRAHADALRAARQQYNAKRDGLRQIMVMRELPESRPAYVLDRGLYNQRREPVVMATPQMLPAMEEGFPRNRLGLAKWLVDRRQPLTARVTVNHYWQLVFGEGLVRTPEDFGRQGALPTHPELLDWLAVDFQEHGWDLKRLLKQMVMSRAYRQSSNAPTELVQKDPGNEWLGRAPSFRLPAEMLRDNALAISGLLVDKPGGPPAKPYELAASFKPSKPDQGDGLYRRSLYTYWKRTGPAPVMLALDAAKRDVCSVKRERTSSPLQALALLNGPQFVEAARVLAKRLMEQHSEPNELASAMFRTMTSRDPDDIELAIVKNLYLEQLKYFQADVDAARQYLSVGRRGIPVARRPIPWPKNNHGIRLGASQSGSEVFRGQFAQARIIKGIVSQEEAREWYQKGRESDGANTNSILLDLNKGDVRRVGEASALGELAGGYLEFTDFANFDPGSSFTLEVWVKPSLVQGRIWDKITPGQGDGFLLDLHGGLRFICGNRTVMATQGPAKDRWSHIICTVDRENDRVRFFMNGSPNGGYGDAPAAPLNSNKDGDWSVANLAAWASVANALMNHDECVTRR